MSYNNPVLSSKQKKVILAEAKELAKKAGAIKAVGAPRGKWKLGDLNQNEYNHLIELSGRLINSFWLNLFT